jgi:hypothetical protein
MSEPVYLDVRAEVVTMNYVVAVAGLIWGYGETGWSVYQHDVERVAIIFQILKDIGR